MARPPEWQPLYMVAEPEPGVWTLADAFDREHSRITIRRTVDGLRFRVEYRGQLIGWATSLREATKHAHAAFLRSHTAGAAPNEGWPEHPAYRPSG